MLINNAGPFEAEHGALSAHADTISAALSRIDFDVAQIENADRTAIWLALRAFEKEAAGAEIAVVYFFGGAVSGIGENFILPADVAEAETGDLLFGAVPVSLLRTSVEPAAALGMVVLDITHDDRQLGALSGQIEPLQPRFFDLATLDENELILLTAAPAQTTVAADLGFNPFARALEAATGEPGLGLDAFLGRLQDGVISQTEGAQVPALYGSVSAEALVMVPEPAVGAVEAVAGSAAADPQSPDAEEARDAQALLDYAFWNAIEASEDPRDYEDYLATFPTGVFVPLARRRLAALQPAAEVVAAGTDVAAAGPEEAGPEVAGPEDAGPEETVVEESLPPADPGAARAAAPSTSDIWSTQLARLMPQAEAEPEAPAAASEPAPASPAVGDPAPAPEEEARTARLEPADAEDVTAAAAPPPAPLPPEPPLPEPLTAREDIRDVQILLGALGQDVGALDGIAGPRTARAVSAYQSSVGLEPDGALTTTLLVRLRAEVSPTRAIAYEQSRRRAAAQAAERRRRAAARQQAAARPTREADEFADLPAISPEPVVVIETEPLQTAPDQTVPSQSAPAPTAAAPEAAAPASAAPAPEAWTPFGAGSRGGDGGGGAGGSGGGD
ncbi:MAG: peptidoglycan-binding protein [Pseudomonadota bacterium]